MKKILVAAMLLLAAIAFANPADWFSGSFEEAKVLAERDGKAILIDFYSDG